MHSKIRDILPKAIKKLIRFFSYSNERKKIFREIYIRRQQNKLLQEKNYLSVSDVIIFIVDGTNWHTGKDNISGGILSIASIYEETKKLKEIHEAEVIMVTFPDDNLLLKHTQFPNNFHVFRFSQLKRFKNLTHVLVHIPEYRLDVPLIEKLKKTYKYLTPDQIHINILNQRFDLMPGVSIIDSIKNQGFTITQTTAHEQYSTRSMREKYQIPLHKLSVYATPERYNYKNYTEKENLILISPDKGELKEEILQKISSHLPKYKVKIINGITYMEYLQWIEKAKYTITFGEGLDFYFIETVFSGGIAFAVYNEVFFTKDFKTINGLFESYDQLLLEIVDSINSLDESTKFSEVNQIQFEACYKIYNGEFYKQNLISFYKKEYLFP